MFHTHISLNIYDILPAEQALSGQRHIVRSIDILQGREYTYTYEEGKIVRAAEHIIEVNSSGFITSRTFENSIIYVYDREGKLIKKKETPKEGAPQTTYYEYPENGNTVVKFTAGGRTVTSHSKTDSFGRKVFDELQLDLGFVSRQFSYHQGETTDTHVEQGKLKSSPTTQLVSRIEFSDGRLMSYEYDEEERITKVTDSLNGVDKVTTYTYDALGQLTSEIVDGVKTGFEYDNYGNILAKGLCGSDGAIAEDTMVVYTYGDTVWKDRLTGFNGQRITYDEQGNPTSYLGHTLSWEKGRQFKSFDGHTYTYNANGIRTSKTVNGVKHNYTLEGSKILRETWGTNELVTLFDNEENVCGLVYNDEPYYFMKNLQGDVIAITDRSGTVVARYSYDAWGVCTIEQDNAYCIGGMDPYRYRGYYYDSEIGMYYLQSRYYDPAVGRFVNADDVVFGTILAKIVIAHNVFTYCYNAPIKMLDLYGYEGVLIAGVFIILIVLFAYFSIVRITTNPKAQDIWRNWCREISNGLNAIWNKITILFQSAARVVEKAVTRNVAKAKEVIRTKQHQEYYWIASKVTFNMKGRNQTTYFPCMPISKKSAVSYIRAQGNVFASSRTAAKSLAANVNGSPPVGPEIHGRGVGYFWHYHARKRIGAGKGGGHIFFM